MARIAFATNRNNPDITADDCLAADILRGYGIDVIPAAWDDPNVDWSRFDRVIIRSTWGYEDQFDAFVRWIRSFEAYPSQLWNPPATILANVNKRYLLDLAARGVAIVPTTLAPRADPRPLRACIRESGWDDVVIKSAVGASGNRVWRSSLATAERDEPRFAAELEKCDLLVQPYCPEILDGEWSLVFFDGEFSHAVRKLPAAGEFRVQEHFGGSHRPATAAPQLIAAASSVISTRAAAPIASTCFAAPLYARVDGIERDGAFLLMELELTEPHLLLAGSHDGPQRFADAIRRTLN